MRDFWEVIMKLPENELTERELLEKKKFLLEMIDHWSYWDRIELAKVEQRIRELDGVAC